MSGDESPADRLRRLWAGPGSQAPGRAEVYLRKRLEAARRRRDSGERPFPVDNLVLRGFFEEPNPLEELEPEEPHPGLMATEVLQMLRLRPSGYTVGELCEILGRPAKGGGGVRDSLDHLRNKFFQPIINDGGVFRLLRPGEY